MKHYYVYIVRCSDKSYYTGITNDVLRRVTEHNTEFKPKSYTFSRRPVSLVYVESYPESMPAILREKQIKNWSRKKKEALIADNIDKLHQYASCLNETASAYYEK